MGRRLTQKIYECSICGNIPDDGETLWEMGVKIVCEKCIEIIEKRQEEEK